MPRSFVARRRSTVPSWRLLFYASLGFALCCLARVWNVRPVHAKGTGVKPWPNRFGALVDGWKKSLSTVVESIDRSRRNRKRDFLCVCVCVCGCVGGGLIRRRRAGKQAKLFLFPPLVVTGEEEKPPGTVGGWSSLYFCLDVVRLINCCQLGVIILS